MKRFLPFKHDERGAMNTSLVVIFSIVLGGLILQMSNTVSFKLAQSQRIKSAQSADNFIRLAIKRTQALLSDQIIAVYNKGEAYPQMELYNTIDNVTAYDGGTGQADYLRYKFKNPRYTGVATAKNPEFIYVKVYMLQLAEDQVANEDELDNVRNTYIKARAVMEDPYLLTLTVNLKPYLKLYTQVTSGYDHTCAVAGSGEAYCWGNNRWGQLGIGSSANNNYAIPQKVTGGHYFQWVAAGKYFTCGLVTTTPDEDNGYRIYCWGRNDQGQLGSVMTADAFGEHKKSTPTLVNETNVPVNGRFRASKLVAGEVHACALGWNFGAAYCWGRQEFTGIGYGALACNNATVASRLLSCPVPLPTRVAQGEQPGGYTNFHACEISASPHHTCIMARNNTTSCTAMTGESDPGTYFCWGENGSGQLGVSDTTDRATPAEVDNPPNVFFGLILVDPFVLSDWKNWSQSNLMTYKDGTCGYYTYNFLGWVDLVRVLFCWGRYDTAVAVSTTPRRMCASGVTTYCRYIHAMTRDRNDQFWVVARNSYLSSDGLIEGIIPRSDAETLRVYKYSTGLGKDEVVIDLPGLVDYPGFMNPLSKSASAMDPDGHTCILTDDRRLYCFGENGSGQLGLGDMNGDGTISGSDFNDQLPTSGGVLNANTKVTIVPRKVVFP